MREKYGALIKDLFYFTLSTFIPKAISFFLVPLYTNCLTPTEYGIADLISTSVSLIIPILTVDISDAVMRFTIEDKEDKRPFNISLFIIINSVIFMCSLFLLNIVFDVFKVNYSLVLFFLMNYISISIYGVCISYIRAEGQVKLLSIISTINTSVTVFSNIVLLLILRMGLTGYLVSTCAGYIIADIIILFRYKNAISICNRTILDKQITQKMIGYSAPLVAANISWWINSSSDRYIVAGLCGVKTNGIYSVSYKIPTILQLLQSVFSQAWLLSAFREYDKTDGDKYVSNIYELYYVAMSLSCGLLILFDIPLAKFLYAKEFFEAWKYVPFLLVSVVFISHAGFFESLLSLRKKTRTIAITTIIGAISNIFMNFVLIPYLGALGAAIATALGYLLMWLTRIRPVMREYYFDVKWRKLFIICVLLVFEALLLLSRQNYFLCILTYTLLCLLNIDVIKKICTKAKNILLENKI